MKMKIQSFLCKSSLDSPDLNKSKDRVLLPKYVKMFFLMHPTKTSWPYQKQIVDPQVLNLTPTEYSQLAK